MPDSVSIPARFNGPRQSGNGGYASGVVAGLLGGTAEVSLRSPVPLDRDLDVVAAEDGSLSVRDGEQLVAEARPSPGFELEVPGPVTPAQAREASARYRGSAEGLFSHCFVCGPAREDAFGVFAGPVGDGDLVASPWTPPEWTADAGGEVRPEFVWSVLDCPTYFALYHREEELPLSFLGRLTARVERRPVAGEEHVVIAWPIERDGRKHHAGSAVLSREGEVVARAHALLIAPR